MKVLYIVSTLRRSGPTRQLLNIATRMHRASISCCVLTLSPEPRSSLQRNFVKARIPVISLASSRFKGAVFGRAMIERQIHSLQPDVVHLQGIRADTLFAFGRRRRSYAVMTTQRNDPWEDYLAKFGPVVGRAMAISHVAALRKLPTVVACSRSISERAESYGIATHTIPNGVDEEWFSMAEHHVRQSTRRKYELGDKGRLFITTGSLIPRKRVDLLIRAIAHCEAVSLMILGSGPLESQLRRIASDFSVSERVRFVGDVEDVRPWLWASDGFVSASRAEGLPNAVLEAMATGLPVLLSNIGPHKEILKRAEGGLAGQCFDSENPEAIAMQMMDIRLDIEARRASRRVVEHAFSASSTALQYAALYNELVGAEE